MSLRRAIFNNFRIKLIAVVIGVVIWMFAKGEQEADRAFLIPLVLRNMPEGLTTVKNPPSVVEVSLEGDNSNLVRLDLWGNPYAVVDMSGAQSGRMLTVSMSPGNIVLPRDSGVKVLEVRNPHSLDLDIDRLVESPVKVNPAITGEPAEGYYVLGEARCVPDTVAMFGPSRVVLGLSEADTEPLNIEGRRSRVDVARRVVLPDDWNLYAIPREVRVIVEIEGTRVVTLTDVPAVLEHELGFPNATMEPTTVELTLSGPEHLVQSLTPEDVRVTVDAMGLYRGTHEVVPEVTAPEGVEVHAVTPPRVRVTLN